MTSTVAEAIDELKAAHPDASFTLREDADGGVFVILEPVDPGPTYTQRETWVGFQITFQYPYSDVYPHFVRHDLTRVDGQQLGEATSQASFEGRPAIQISRKSNRLNPATDTAAVKLLKVLEWLRNR
jgi:hypothetical protein